MMAVEDPEGWNTYINRLSEVAGRSIGNFAELLEALRERQRVFAAAGCRLSDHGLDTFYGEEFTDGGLESLFAALRRGGD